MRQFEWSGTHREVGMQHGDERRDEIAELIATLERNVEIRRHPSAEQLDLDGYVAALYRASRRFAPDIAEELEGIAAGSGIEISKIVFLNAFLDLVSLRHELSVDALLGCTSFAVAPPATDHEVFVGQNYDMEHFYRDFAGIHRISVKDKPTCQVFTFAGVVGCAGMNDAGIGLCINFLHTAEPAVGVLYPFLVRAALAQQRIGDAIGALTVATRAGGMHYLLADAGGILVSVETSSDNHDVVFAMDGVATHANHYCSNRLRMVDAMVGLPSYSSAIARRGSTLVRQHVSERSLRGKTGLTLDDLKQLCRSHVNYPYSVCFHGDESQQPTLRGYTIASLIFDLSGSRLHVSAGADHTEYQEIGL